VIPNISGGPNLGIVYIYCFINLKVHIWFGRTLSCLWRSPTLSCFVFCVIKCSRIQSLFPVVYVFNTPCFLCDVPSFCVMWEFNQPYKSSGDIRYLSSFGSSYGRKSCKGTELFSLETTCRI